MILSTVVPPYMSIIRSRSLDLYLTGRIPNEFFPYEIKGKRFNPFPQNVLLSLAYNQLKVLYKIETLINTKIHKYKKQLDEINENVINFNFLFPVSSPYLDLVENHQILRLMQQFAQRVSIGSTFSPGSSCILNKGFFCSE